MREKETAHSRVRRAVDDCPPGFYKRTDGTGGDSCALCQQGSYCAGGQAAPQVCQFGQFSGMGASSCTACSTLTATG